MRKKLITAIVTPLKDDKTIDYFSLEKLINFQIEGGVDGILFAGSTGEKFGLSNEEFFELNKFIVKNFKNRFEIIFNSGTFNTKESILNSRKCEELGSDSLLLANPYYNKPTQEGLYNHFKSIANAVKIPVYLYNIPGRTSVNLNIDTLKRLMEVENIKGIKESSGNFSQIVETFKLAEEAKKNGRDFSVFCGDDNMILPFFSLGAQGCISVISNIFPKAIKKISSFFDEGEHSYGEALKVKALYFKIFSLTEALCRIGNNPIAIKTILAREGFIKENFFEPLCPLDEKQKKELFTIFDEVKEGLKGLELT